MGCRPKRSSQYTELPNTEEASCRRALFRIYQGGKTLGGKVPHRDMGAPSTLWSVSRGYGARDLRPDTEGRCTENNAN